MLDARAIATESDVLLELVLLVLGSRGIEREGWRDEAFKVERKREGEQGGSVS